MWACDQAQDVAYPSLSKQNKIREKTKYIFKHWTETLINVCII